MLDEKNLTSRPADASADGLRDAEGAISSDYVERVTAAIDADGTLGVAISSAICMRPTWVT